MVNIWYDLWNIASNLSIVVSSTRIADRRRRIKWRKYCVMERRLLFNDLRIHGMSNFRRHEKKILSFKFRTRSWRKEDNVDFECKFGKKCFEGEETSVENFMTWEEKVSLIRSTCKNWAYQAESISKRKETFSPTLFLPTNFLASNVWHLLLLSIVWNWLDYIGIALDICM